MKATAIAAHRKIPRDERYIDAKMTADAFSKVLAESLDDGQRILLRRIINAHRVMNAIESKAQRKLGRCRM